MSLNVLTQGGGAGGEFASIFVTGLSATDTVAAVKDGKTVQGKWNSAENRFEISKIKEYGMWTVTATNGEETITQDVLVDAAVEYEIEMLFRLYLYREGDECEEVTGGWVAQGLGWEAAYNVPSAPTLTKNSSNMAVSRTNASSYECGIILPRNKIDLTGYKTINAIVDYSMINAACMFAGFIRSSLGSVCIDGDRWFRLNNANNPTSKALVSYDISSYDGLFVLYFALYSTGNGAIHKLWLE